jgi:hypothetical protein
MEMPGSAPGVWKERWQYCPMRTRGLRGLTLAVVLAHAITWQAAAGRWPVFALSKAGVHRLQLVSLPQRAAVPPAALATAADAAVATAPVQPSVPAHATPAHRVATGAGGTRRSAPPEAVEWPMYPTRPPPSATLHYALAQSTAAASAPGSAEIAWQRDGGTFSLRVATRVDGRPPREWQSVGGFDAAGLAPVRLVERDGGRDKRAVNFDRDGARVRFSGASGALAIAPGAQDRWSWVAQLAAIAEAEARHAPRQRGADPPARQPARQWDLQVASLRGELERWTFRVLPPGELPAELQAPGHGLSSTGEQASDLLHVLRTPSRPYDLRIEAWLSPSLHHLPAGLRMSTPPGPWSLALWLGDS